MNKSSKIYLIPHEIGKIHLENLAEHLKNIRFVAAFTSDLIEGEEAAKIILKYQEEIPLFVTYLLRGKLEIKSPASTPSQHAFYSRAMVENINPQNEKLFNSFTTMESDKQVVKRLTNVLSQAAKDYKGQSILIVSHGDVIRILLTYLKHGNYQKLALVKLIADGVRFQVIND